MLMTALKALVDVLGAGEGKGEKEEREGKTRVKQKGELALVGLIFGRRIKVTT
jgi:hypothetical protein